MGILDYLTRIFVLNEGTVNRTASGLLEVGTVARITKNPYAVITYLLTRPDIVDDITATVRDEQTRAKLHPILRYLLTYVPASYLIDIYNRVFRDEDVREKLKSLTTDVSANSSPAINEYVTARYGDYARVYSNIHDRLMDFSASNIRWANRSAIANSGHPGTRFYSDLYFDDMYYRDTSKYTPFYGDGGIERGQRTPERDDHFMATLRARLTSQTAALTHLLEEAEVLPEVGLNVFMVDDPNDARLVSCLAEARLVFGNALDEGTLPVYTPYAVLYAMSKYMLTPKMIGTAELFRTYGDVVASAWAQLLGETRFNSWF